MKNQYALKLENVTKRYYLGKIGWGTLKKDLQSYIAKKRGLEDPNAPIGYGGGKDFDALKDISLEIKKGEVIGIIGANGAGKSTLLKLISGLTIPTSGKIYLNGKVTSILEVGTGFHGELTGRENIYLNGSILGMKKEVIDSMMDNIISFAELEQFIDTPVKRYSSGMYIRLGFSVAVHLLSDIVIIDEALAVGDVNFQTKALDKLKELAREDKRTILYVSHNMTTIKDLCEKCIVLKKGKLNYFGAVDKAIELYRQQDQNKEVEKIITPEDHATWIIPKKMKLKKISFIDKKENIFTSNEKIGLKLQWENLENVEQIGIRTVIINYNREAVGSSIYHGTYKKNKKENEIKLYYSFPNLVPGSYYIAIALFEYDAKNNEIIDDYCLGLNFKIQDQDNVNWNAPRWGSILFDSPTLTKTMNSKK